MAAHKIPMNVQERRDVERWLAGITAKLNISQGEAIHRAVEMMAAWHEIDGLRLSEIEREKA